jgi:ribonuclease BN (tRNA processing enzyme)
MLKKLPFPLEWHEFSPGKSELWKQATWTVAQSLHRMPNFSVRIEEAGHAVCYSGDGAPSDATEALYRGASLLIHEAYYDAPQRSQSHASVPGVLELSQRCAVKTLHVLHRKRSLLRPVNVHVPAPGDVVELR